jgi:hypothetical protein
VRVSDRRSGRAARAGCGRWATPPAAPDDDDDNGFRSGIRGDFSTNPDRKLYELDDRLDKVQDTLDDLEDMRENLQPGFGSKGGGGGGSVRYVDPKYGYVLQLPEGMPAPTETGQGAVVSAGKVGDMFMAIAAVGIPVPQEMSNAELKIAANSFADGLGGRAVEIKSYTVLGKRTWGGIYEKDDGFRLEAVFYPADGYVLAVSIGTQTSDFAASKAQREDFLRNGVSLK